MEGLLTAVKTTSLATAPSNVNLAEPQQRDARQISSPQDALDALKGQPSFDQLAITLSYLAADDYVSEGFSVAAPGPLSTRILYILVNSTVPDYWQVLSNSDSHERERDDLVRCLGNVGGLGALVARLKALIHDSQENHKQFVTGAGRHHIEDILQILDLVLIGNDVCLHFWTTIQKIVGVATKQVLLWREFITIIGTGKVNSLCAQAEDVLKNAGTSFAPGWIADGVAYASWLGRNVAALVISSQPATSGQHSAAAQLCGKSFSLGYTNKIVMEILKAFIFSEEANIEAIPAWLKTIQMHEQRRFLGATTSFLNEILQPYDHGSTTVYQTSQDVSAAAALLHHLIRDNNFLKDYLVSWLSNSSNQMATVSIRLIRAAISALQQDEDRVQKVMEKSLEIFGDTLYIKHTPLLHQEILAQTLLLVCGYVHRQSPMFLFAVARSSTNTGGISNRLSASSPRARFLGMVVGSAISRLVDKPEAHLKFEVDEAEAEDAQRLTSLVDIEDTIGSISHIRAMKSFLTAEVHAHGIPKRQVRKKTPTTPPKSFKPLAPKASLIQEVGPRIVEVDEISEDDDLRVYAKPDSDPEDEDEDPTLVKRNKPTAPVYIRDLISGLQEREDYDRHVLALSTAASLIRRKSNFGKEVTDHINELASVLISLTDQFEVQNFQEMRQQALIAVLLAQPAIVGPAFTKAYFEGEYSIQQRIAVLTAIGLGARELAGFKDVMNEGYVEPGTAAAFPSKLLPSHLHEVFGTGESHFDSVAKGLEKSIMQPLALEAADKLTGPNILKVRTFSSRMEVEKRRKKPIANELAKVVAQSFFFPLTGRWWGHIQANGTKSLHAGAQLLPVYLKTLALLIHSSGPSTLLLPSLTTEFWDLLLNVRSLAINDISVMEALLFSFLTLLEVNENQQRLVQENSKELLETQVWVREVFERLGSGNEDDERVRMLAAGVLVRCQEVVEKFQRLLMGDMVGF